MADAAVGDLRDVDQPAHAFGQLDERAKILQPIDLAGDDRADCELLFDLLPRVLFQRLDRQRYPLLAPLAQVFGAQNRDLDLLPYLEDFLGMADALMADLRDVHQALYPGTQLDKRPKRLQPRHLALQLRALLQLAAHRAGGLVLLGFE